MHIDFHVSSCAVACPCTWRMAAWVLQDTSTHVRCIMGIYMYIYVRACRAEGTGLLAPVALLHALAFGMGYFLSRLFFSEKTARTISIETGAPVSATLIPPCITPCWHAVLMTSVCVASV